MLDRIVGVLVFTIFAPALALLTLLVGVVCEGPVFEWRLRIEGGTLYRTRRFRPADCRLSRFLNRYELDNLPGLLDIAAGHARFCCTIVENADGASQMRFAIRAPRAKTASHPTAASASQTNRITE